LNNYYIIAYWAFFVKETHCQSGVVLLHFQLRQNEHLVCVLDGMVEQLLPINVATGDGEHVVLLQNGANLVCK